MKKNLKVIFLFLFTLFLITPVPSLALIDNEPGGGGGGNSGSTASLSYPYPCLILTRDLSYGSTGSEVVDLQKFLIAGNYLATLPTGFFGPATESAVKAFQLEYDGVLFGGYFYKIKMYLGKYGGGYGKVGPLTRAAIQRLTCSNQVPPTTTTPISTSTPTSTPVTGNTVNVKLYANGSINSAYRLAKGDNLTLNWVSTGATYCKWNSPLNNVGALVDGSITYYSGHPQYPSVNGTTYSMTCLNTNGVSANASIFVSFLDSTSSSSPVSTKFSIGDSIKTTSTINVRSSANGNLLGTQQIGSFGKIVSGPIYTGGYSWWQVDYNSGYDGWSAEDFLELYSNPTTNTGTTASVDLRVGPQKLKSTTITNGDQVTLSWIATPSTMQCVGSGASYNNYTSNWNGSQNSSGSVYEYPYATTNYVLKCTNPDTNQTYIDSVTVYVNSASNINTPTVDIKANSSDGPVTLSSGQDVVLSWTSANATYCTIGSPVNSGVLVNGSNTYYPSHLHYPSSGGTTYTITCTDSSSGKSASDSVTVNVSQATPTSTVAPTVDLKANNTNGPVSITSGNTVSLSWTSTPSTSSTLLCNASGASSGTWNGYKSLIGLMTVSPTISTTYTITCTDSSSGKSASDSVTVNVSQATPTSTVAPTVSIYANYNSTSYTITSGQYVELTWSSTNATSCAASNSWSGTKAISGSLSVYPSTNSTYEITCSGSGGTVSDSVSVYVSTISTTPSSTVDIKANGSDSALTLSSGQNLNLTWTSTNTTSCSIGSPINSGVYTNGSSALYEGHPHYPSSGGTTYTITCYDSSGGSVTDSVTVSSAPKTTINSSSAVNIKANNSEGPITLASGQDLTISWTSTGASYCEFISPFNSGVLLSSSDTYYPGHPFYPKSSGTTYTVRCSISGNMISDSVLVYPYGSSAMSSYQSLASVLQGLQAVLNLLK